jgi:hypothetical protein
LGETVLTVVADAFELEFERFRFTQLEPSRANLLAFRFEKARRIPTIRANGSLDDYAYTKSISSSKIKRDNPPCETTTLSRSQKAAVSPKETSRNRKQR